MQLQDLGVEGDGDRVGGFLRCEAALGREHQVPRVEYHLRVILR